MTDIDRYKLEVSQKGFTIIDKIYSEQEIEQILLTIDKADDNKETFRKSGSGVVNTRVDESYVTKLLGYFKSR